MRRYILLFLAAGCAETAYYVPTDNVSAQGTSGQPAASYVMQATNGDRIAEVNVWSHDVHKTNDTSLMHATLEVRNVSNQPIRLDPTLLHAEAFAEHDVPMATPRLAGISPQGPAALTVPPRAARNFEVYFSSAPGVSPGDVKAFRLRWGLNAENQQFVQFTQFKREVPYYYWNDYYGYGYYGYGWYGGWPYWYNPYGGPGFVTVQQQAAVSRPVTVAPVVR
jgi:hypothetical protein